MYKLHLPIISLNRHTQDEINKIKALLIEILGYSELEVNSLEEREFRCDIVTGITIDEALKIAQPFEDWDLPLPYLESESGLTIGYNRVGGLQPPNPKEHYCDEPMVSREHLIDVFSLPTKKQIKAAVETAMAMNKPKCPICQSINLTKISELKKAAKVGLFGIFGAGDIGKTWKCNNCGSRF